MDKNIEEVASLAVLLQALVLAGVLALGHLLSRWRWTRWLGEAGVALALGAAISCLVNLLGTAKAFQPYLVFDKEFFFLAVLPPIIFQAGYCLNTETFFSNIGAISVFAFAGTAISTLVIGLVLWLAGVAGLSFLEALLFGSIVSATDPVTVLAVFDKLGADPNLYALVFGESVLNDAVAIVLYRVLAAFLHEAVTVGAVFRALGAFLLIFLGSMAIGASVGFLVSYVVKTKALRSEHAPLESCFVVLLAWCSYLLADSLHLSGIVSVLFCGVVMAFYTKPNQSRVSRDRTGAFFKVLATLAETFVFVYIGASLFISQQAVEHDRIASFVAVTLVALALSRAANIWPLSAAVNYLRTEDTRVPQSHRFMLWWAGLRGAMAFALALQAADDVPGQAGELMLTCVYVVIFITVFINGGFCAVLLSKLHLMADDAHLGSPSHSKYQRLVLPSEDGEDGQGFSASVAVVEGDGSLTSHVSPPLGGPIPSPPAPAPTSASRLERLRQANKQGLLLPKLNRLDEKFLARTFLAAERGVEMSEVVPPGDVDPEEQVEGHPAKGGPRS